MERMARISASKETKPVQFGLLMLMVFWTVFAVVKVLERTFETPDYGYIKVGLFKVLLGGILFGIPLIAAALAADWTTRRLPYPWSLAAYASLALALGWFWLTSFVPMMTSVPRIAFRMGSTTALEPCVAVIALPLVRQVVLESPSLKRRLPDFDLAKRFAPLVSTGALMLLVCWFAKLGLEVMGEVTSILELPLVGVVYIFVVYSIFAVPLVGYLLFVDTLSGFLRFPWNEAVYVILAVWVCWFYLEFLVPFDINLGVRGHEPNSWRFLPLMLMASIPPLLRLKHKP